MQPSENAFFAFAHTYFPSFQGEGGRNEEVDLMTRITILGLEKKSFEAVICSIWVSYRIEASGDIWSEKIVPTRS